MRRREFLIGGAMAIPSVLSAAEPVRMLDCGRPDSVLCRQEREWRAKATAARNAMARKQKAINSREVKALLAEHGGKRLRHAIVGPQSRRLKLTRTAILDANAETRWLSVKAFPLTDINGQRASRATFDFWKKGGWGDNQSLATSTSSEFLKDARVNRSYRVGNFSTHSLIIYGVGPTKINP